MPDRLQNPYESGKLLAEYLLFHYGSEEAIFGQLPAPRDACDFPVRCVYELVDFAALSPRARALDVGCAVGRSSFELGRFCAEVVGIDLSESFIQAARILQDKGALSFEVPAEGDICDVLQVRVPEGLDRERVRFQLGDATKLPDGLGTFDLVLAANLICRLPEPRLFLRRLSQLVNPGGQLLLTTPFTWLEEFTSRAEWLGGRREEGIRSREALKGILDPNFELQLMRDLPFLIREHERKFQYGIALGGRWVRRD
ncbi:MAG TPA: putative 4-mercaptohistidine N1-methyltransferase [Terrimicrobiaceae bacterium]